MWLQRRFDEKDVFVYNVASIFESLIIAEVLEPNAQQTKTPTIKSEAFDS